MEVAVEYGGIFSLGAVVGGLVIYFIHRFKAFNVQALIGVVGVLSGAGVVGIFKLAGQDVGASFWMYPIGLLVGAGGIALMSMNTDEEEDGEGH